MANKALLDLFSATSIDRRPAINPPMETLESHFTPEYLEDFKIPFVSGFDTNPGANLIPTQDDRYTEIGSTRDFRLGSGLGISRAWRKQDSQLAHEGNNAVYGRVYGNRNPGRSDRSIDFLSLRAEHEDRARVAGKHLGTKAGEHPAGTYFKPHEWNAVAGYGDPRYPNNSNYNRNWPRPDAEQVVSQTYKPAPSRLTKMHTAEIDVVGLMPQQTTMDPLDYALNDLARQQIRRPRRNADVLESVRSGSEMGVVPRGAGPYAMEHPRVYGDANQHRRPIGTQDTGNRAVTGRWGNPSVVYDFFADSLEDRTIAHKSGQRYIRGYDLDEEMRMYVAGRKEEAAPNVGFRVQDYSLGDGSPNGPFPAAVWPTRSRAQ